jgi:mono/diheme cytochrome c family protein
MLPDSPNQISVSRWPFIVVVLGIFAAASFLLCFGGGTAAAFTKEQVAKGAETFRLQCARCHGPSGRGISDVYKNLTAPPLIGPGSLPPQPRSYQKVRHFDFQNIRDVYEFASSVMPLDQPASLNPDDYWNVIAYILDKDGMKPNGSELNANNAENIKIAAVDKQEQSSQNAAGAPSTTAAESYGFVGSPPNPNQIGPAAAVVGNER